MYQRTAPRLVANVRPQEEELVEGTLALADREEFPFEAVPAEEPVGL